PWWLPPDAPQSQVPANQAPERQEPAPPVEGRAVPRISAEPLPPPVPASPVQLKLQGIIIGKNERTAILNGKPFYEGDRIGNARIVAITRDGVSVSNAAGTNILTVK
ncbi:MAG: hypothetical protein NTW03_05160, partial [Verrucomicrobia bacterium]|nr:hypothetical protein [Verrucomicrobiota bacterium]